MDKTDVFVFDCDGVIWKGDKLIDGVPETLDMLKAMGKRMFFVTNNSTKSRKGYLKKFQSLGLKVLLWAQRRLLCRPLRSGKRLPLP